MTDKQADKQTNKQAPPMTNSPTNGQASKQADMKPKKAREPKPPQESAGQLLAQRVHESQAMAEGQTMTVTLRIPVAMNRWLDEYVHRAWPEKVRKQELVVEALQLLFARRGRPGEPLIETELLGDKDR
jgi:hypothetical protein